MESTFSPVVEMETGVAAKRAARGAPAPYHLGSGGQPATVCCGLHLERHARVMFVALVAAIVTLLVVTGACSVLLPLWGLLPCQRARRVSCVCAAAHAVPLVLLMPLPPVAVAFAAVAVRNNDGSRSGPAPVPPAVTTLASRMNVSRVMATLRCARVLGVCCA